MNQQKTLPVFMIEGTSFLVDTGRQVLRQTDDPNNEISFISQMQDHGAFYRLLYDPDERRAARDTSDQDRVMVIDVPQLVELDPEGMAEKYQLTVGQLRGKSDFEVIVDQQALALRQQGVLPQIDIAGEAFIIDLRLKELRNARYFFPVISLKSFELAHDGWKYAAYYDPVNKQIVELDTGLTEFPEGVIRIQIPNEIGLDPVATAREHGIAERELLRLYPIRKALKAEVIPLSETNIPALIQRNREHLLQEHREIARRIKPRNRLKF